MAGSDHTRGNFDKGSIHETQFGETSINEDDRAYLTPAYAHIAIRDEQNRAEALNIAVGLEWLDEQTGLDVATLLTQSFLRQLHRQMFGRVWTWAGMPRLREATIGVEPAQITERWEQLLGDARYWIAHSTYPPDEICIRLHHRQVAVHPFTNGNGRHARVTANKLAELLGLIERGVDRYTWGASAASDVDAARREYLDALRQADQGKYETLVALALRP